MPQHRPERHDPGTAGDQHQRPAVLRSPDEVAADRTVQLDLVARPHHLRQYGETSPSTRRSTVIATGSPGADAIEYARQLR